MNARKLSDDTFDSIIKEASSVLAGGGVILAPTDTIYGLACDATSGGAVSAVARLKQRPTTMPFIVLVPAEAELAFWVQPLSEESTLFIREFAAASVTFVLNPSDRARREIVQVGSTIAVRIPHQKFSRDLCRKCGKPLLSTSANIHGDNIPASIQEVNPALLDGVDLVIDAGVLQIAPSTIVDLTGTFPRVIREGAISKEQLQARRGLLRDDY